MTVEGLFEKHGLDSRGRKVETITPESLSRPITAEQLRADDVVTIKAPSGNEYRFTVESDDALSKWADWNVLSISRPIPDVPEQVELPSEPGFYVSYRDGFWQLDPEGQWWFRGYPDRHPTPDQQDRTAEDVLHYAVPLTRLVPAGSEREAELTVAATLERAARAAEESTLPLKDAGHGDLNHGSRSQWYANGRRDAARVIRALVPEAEGERA